MMSEFSVTEFPNPNTDDEDDELNDVYNYANIISGDQTAKFGTGTGTNVNSISTNLPHSGFGSSNTNFTPQAFQGVLNKWTNYIHGWQNRFIVLKDGVLSYYKSEHELAFGCRGSISILKATIRPHDLDECRFDVSVNDCVWYLRAESAEEKVKWVEALEHYKADSGSDGQSLRRHGSAMSISSNTLSGTSGSSFRKGHGLNAKLAELETYRDILQNSIDTLQKYFDNLAAIRGSHQAAPLWNSSNVDNSNANFGNVFIGESQHDAATDLLENMSGQLQEIQNSNDLNIVDFRGEALTFKATTSGVLTAISHCIEVMSQREDVWKRRLDIEIEKRRKNEEYYKQALQEAQTNQKVVMMGPDCEEGPHSSLKEDEFYDAVEQGLDRMEEEQDFRERLKSFETVVAPISLSGEVQLHPLWPEIDKVTLQQLHYARLDATLGEGGWELFAEEGEMKMYKREEEVDGLVVDPLKAQHSVKGFTAHEMCHYFFSPDVRMEWETTLEQMTILEKVSDDTLIFLQIHKRIWPATQRDALFWSHIREVPDSNDPKASNIWIVCNHSTDHNDAPIKSNGKYIRVFLTVSLVCQTVITPPKNGAEISRDDLTCRITYCSVVNPGGWAPASVLRAVYKREYPRFLKKFTQYVLDKCKDKPIMF